jgi:hypothetical protein
MLQSARTSVNDVAKHKNKGKRGEEVYAQRQLRFLSTRTREKEVPKNKIKSKRGC